MSRHEFRKRNHLLSCLVYMGFCALIQAALYFLAAKRPNIAGHVAAVHLFIAIDCIVYVAGKIILLKMELQKKEEIKIERVRHRFFLFEIIWYSLTSLAFYFLIYNYS